MDKDKIDKKDHILDVAERVFAEVGYDGASTRLISGEAGVNMAMLNYYFGSKEGLFIAIFERRITAFQSLWQQINNSVDKSPWQKVETYVDTWVERIFNNNCFQKILYQEISMRKRGDLADKVNTILIQNIKGFHSMLNDGIELGAFNKDIDIQLLTATIFGTKNYIMNSPYVASMMFGFDITDEKVIEETFKPRIKKYFKTLLKSYLVTAHDHSDK